MFKSKPERLVYNFTNEERKMLDTNHTSICVVLELMECNTGAIGYFSNRNELEIATITTYGGVVRAPESGKYLKILTSMKIFTKNV